MAGIVAMAIGVPAMVSASDVDIGADVGNADPVVEWKWEWQDPDEDLPATDPIELMPDQAMYKCVLVSDANGNDDIVEIIWHFNETGTDEIPATADDVIIHTEKLSWGDFTLVTETTDKCWTELQSQNPTLYATAVGNPCYSMYKGTWTNVPMELQPGVNIYHVQVQAIDAQGAESPWLINYVTILEKMQLDVDVGAVDFGAVENFVYDVITGDAIWDPADPTNPTIRNTGNVPIDVEVACAAGLTCTTPATCDGTAIPEGDLDAKVGAEAEAYLSACFNVNLASLTNTNLDLSIDIGHDGGQPVPPGAYSGTATVTALTACMP